jgi:hypothetical protein
VKKPSPFKFRIGEGPWIQEIRYYTAEIDPNYWARFRPLSADEISAIETSVNRRLPEDLKEFLRAFGCGTFPEPFGGDIYTPEDFIRGCYGHLYMILGSAEWASEEDHQRFYVTHGVFNPAPNRFTPDALQFDGVNLLDLLQCGTDGGGGYHQVYVGDRPNPIGYGLFTPSQTMEDAAPSFSEGLKLILTHHWQWGDTEDLPTTVFGIKWEDL